jgi:trimethylamine---corrinoid protein Co-methyltransferase
VNEKLQQIHEASMEILETVGFKIYHEGIIKLLRENGIKISNQTAFFKSSQVMEWVGKAPEKFTLHARNPKHDMEIGGVNRYFAAGYGAPHIIERDGTRRDARLDDYLAFLKLVQQCHLFSINGGILAQPSDIPARHATIVMLAAALVLSDKCIMGIPGRANEVQQVMELAEISFGGVGALEKTPRILTLINTLSPLQLDLMAAETISICSRYDQPIIVSPSPMAGSTGPVTMAGTIALSNAEALATIAISQILKPGLPVIFGLQATTTDMKTGDIAVGTPDQAMAIKYCSLLAKRYHLPSRAGGAAVSADTLSAQSGYESMLTMNTSMDSGINLIIHSAGILDRFGAMSYEKFIVDLEIISMLQHCHRDITITKDTLAMDTIKRVGPGGEFLTASHTLKNCRTASWIPEISNSSAGESENFNKEYSSSIEKKKNNLINGYQTPDLDPNIKENLKKYLENIGIDTTLKEIFK